MSGLSSTYELVWTVVCDPFGVRTATRRRISLVLVEPVVRLSQCWFHTRRLSSGFRLGSFDTVISLLLFVDTYHSHVCACVVRFHLIYS